MTPGGLASAALLSAFLLSAVAGVIGAFGRTRAARLVHHATMVASALVGLTGASIFLASGVTAQSLGASPLLFGAPLVVDRLSAFFLLLLHSVSLMTSWFGAKYTEGERHHYPLGVVLPVTAVFVLSMQGVLLASGLAGFLLFWEAMSLSAFLLVMADREPESRQAALLYLAIAQFGAGALIVGCGILGGGSLFATFETLSSSAGLLPAGWSTVAMALVLFAFTSKAGLAPFHAWLPEAHPRAPSHVSALMSGAMLKVAIYGLLRFTAVCWPAMPAAWGIGLLALGLVGAAVAVIYANIARDIKRVLAWSSVENIGLAFGMFGFQVLLRRAGSPVIADAVMAAMFLHLLAHALFKSGLFLGAGAIMHAAHTGKIEMLGGLAARMPRLSAGAMALCLAAAALPPFGSFVAEFMLLQSALAAMATRNATVAAAGVAVLIGVAFVAGLAVFAMVRLFAFVFLAEPRSPAARGAIEPAAPLHVPVLALAAGVLALGLLSPWLAFLFPVPFDVLTPMVAAGAAFSRGQGLLVAPALGLSLGIGLCAAWLLRRALGPRSRIRRFHTWDCGQPIDATMEYTATGFSAPVRFFLRDIVRAEKHLVFQPVVASNPWIKRGEMEFRKAGGMLAGLYFPIARLIESVGAALKGLQNGVIQFYIALILATLLFTLWVALWNPAVVTIVQTVFVLAMAPLAAGLVRRFKAFLQGRRGAPVLLPYWTVLTLMRKEIVLSTSTSWVFRAAPFAVLSTAIVSVAVLPLVGRGGAAAPLSHLVIIAGIWMLGAVFLVFAGLDSASAFGGMGASREMTIAAFLEPALIVALAAFAVASGSATVDGMLSVAGAGLIARPWLLPAVAALGLVALGENARYPVDNPATHLELTMVHEAMVLEYSGPYLALMELASMVKLATFALLLANIVVPAGLITPATGFAALAVAPVAALVKLVVVMALLATLESSIAKLRFYGLPEYFFGSLFLGLASLSLGLVAGWL